MPSPRRTRSDGYLSPEDLPSDDDLPVDISQADADAAFEQLRRDPLLLLSPNTPNSRCGLVNGSTGLLDLEAYGEQLVHLVAPPLAVVEKKRPREEEYQVYEGYALKLSQKNDTGYAGVARQKKSQVNPFQAFALGAKGKYLGSFRHDGGIARCREHCSMATAHGS